MAQRTYLPLNKRIKDGRVFEVSNRRRNVTYLRCSKYLCEGTAKIVGSEEITLVHEHSPTICFEDRSAQLIADFKSTLKSMLQTHYWELRVLYDTAVLLFDEQVKVLVPFNSIESSLKRWRKIAFPANPENLEEWDEILRRPENRRLSEYGAGTLVSHRITDSQGKTHILLYDPQFIESTFRSIQQILIDATYQSKPALDDVYQLLTALGVVYNHAIPFMHVLMGSKTEVAYTAVLQAVANLVNSATVKVVMTDFEQALRKASQAVFPNAHITGCNVHYDRALLKKIKTLKLTNLVKSNELAKKFVKKIMALAFLPEDDIFREYVGLTDSLPAELKRKFARFLQYFERQWLIIVKPRGFSVFGLSRRTNNVTESYNSVLAHKMGKHPSPWTFLVKLCKLTSNARDDVMSLRSLKKIKRHPRYSTQYKQNKLMQAWQLLYSGAITATEFLEQVVSLKGHIRQRLQAIEEIPENEEIELIETPRNIPAAEDPDYDAELFEGLRYDDIEPVRADRDNFTASARSSDNGDRESDRSRENDDVESTRSMENDDRELVRSRGNDDVESTRSTENDDEESVQSTQNDDGESVRSTQNDDGESVRSVSPRGLDDARFRDSGGDDLARFGGYGAEWFGGNDSEEEIHSVENDQRINPEERIILDAGVQEMAAREVPHIEVNAVLNADMRPQVAEQSINNLAIVDLTQDPVSDNDRPSGNVAIYATAAVVNDQGPENVEPKVKVSRSKKKNDRKKRSKKRKILQMQNASNNETNLKPRRHRGHKRRRENVQKERPCIVCWEAKITHAFAPCGHYCSCENCAKILVEMQRGTCPKCRKPFTSVNFIYVE